VWGGEEVNEFLLIKRTSGESGLISQILNTEKWKRDWKEKKGSTNGIKQKKEGRNEM